MKVFVPTILLMAIVGSSAAKADGNCTLEETKSMVVHFHWPTVISCDNLISASRRKLWASRNWPPTENSTCFIVDPANNETLWSKELDMTSGFALHGEEYTTEDITKNSTALYHIFLKSNSSCLYEVITLNASEHEYKNCSHNREDSRTVDMKGRKGDFRILTCEAVGHDVPAVHLSDESHNFTLKWYRNCTELNLDDRYRVDGRQLIIKSLDFDMAGIYSCSITYKQNTRFVVNIALCVQPPVYFSKPVIHCPEKAAATIGQDVELICQVDVGLNAISSFRTRLYWNQDSNLTNVCKHSSFGKSIAEGWNGRAECALNKSVAQDHYSKCFLYDPSVEDKSAISNTLNASLVIKNVQSSDFGEYFVRFKFSVHATNDTVLLVEEDHREDKPYYIYTVTALCIATVVVIILVAIVVLVKCRKKSFKS